MANKSTPGDDQQQQQQQPQGQEYIYGAFTNGALVWTRNNVQVLKQKQGDTAFVNTVIQRGASTSSRAASSSSATSPAAPSAKGGRGESKAARFRVRFQDARPASASKASEKRRQSEPRRANPETRGAKDADHSERLVVRRKSTSPEQQQHHLNQVQPKQPKAQEQNPGVPPCISGWIMHDVPFTMTAKDKAALRFYLDVLPRRTYPFEAWHILTYNPLRNRDIYEKLFSEEMVLKCAISVGAVYEASCQGIETIPVMHHYARLCRYIVDLLQQPSLDNRKHVLIQAISTLALLAHWSDRDDLWHMHMNGLQQFIQSTGGVDSLTPEMKWIAYKADITGSAEKALDPLLPIANRQHRSVMDMVDDDKKREITAVFRRWVLPCCTDEKMLDIFISAALFMVAVFRVRETGTGQFHPDAMMEDRYSMAYLIQNYPTPIGAPARDDSASPDASSSSSSPDSVTTASEAAALLKGVETSMRLAISLYGKEIVHDPWDRAGDLPALLGLMARHLRAVTSALREAKREMAAAVHDDGVGRAGFAVVEAVRPLLLFLVVLGWVVSESRRLRGARACDDVEVFADLLVEIVGSNAAHLDGRVPDEYWAICRIAEFRNIRGRDWDLHRTVSRMMDEWLARRES
ncbi:unnamed protein product [Clonostachys chloroleuca]|uniref:Uncharacterized protein n=1 Tax=Clonostachys chloroleuca TaxID=1926264 RepID=A0AA35MCW8_9HYPO|nr:unnamed protein product [Clonostachys chloroleuca]